MSKIHSLWYENSHCSKEVQERHVWIAELCNIAFVLVYRLNWPANQRSFLVCYCPLFCINVAFYIQGQENKLAKWHLKKVCLKVECFSRFLLSGAIVTLANEEWEIQLRYSNDRKQKIIGLLLKKEGKDISNSKRQYQWLVNRWNSLNSLVVIQGD